MNKREIKKLTEKIENAETISDLKYICSENGAEGYLDEYLTDDEALDYIKNHNADCMERLYYCTQEIEDWTADYFYLDAYGNLSNANMSIEDLKKDVLEHIIEIN